MSFSIRLKEVIKQVNSLPDEEKMQPVDHILCEADITKLSPSWELELERRDEMTRQGMMELQDLDVAIRETEEKYGQKD